MVWGVNIFWSSYFSRCALADMSRYVQAAVLQLYVVAVCLKGLSLWKVSKYKPGIKSYLKWSDSWSDTFDFFE